MKFDVSSFGCAILQVYTKKNLYLLNKVKVSLSLSKHNSMNVYGGVKV
jgi:hypothetical protein